MAFSSVGTLGVTVLPKTSGTTQALAISADAEVGNVVVVGSAWDNAGTSQADTSQLSIADDSGNTWIKIRERTYSAGAANDGVTVAVWVSKITTQISSGANITVTSASARTAKVTGAWEFAMGSGTLTFDGVAGTDYQTASAAAGDPASISLASLASQEYLLIHAIGSEGGTTHTADGDYTERHDTETTGGAVATNISLFLATRIATLTGDTVDAASTTDRDHAQVLGAVYEDASGGSSETPTPGGAVAGGAGPSTQASAAQGGATAAGTTPGPKASAPQGGATAQGTTAAAFVAVAAGGATAGGVAPAEPSGGESETPTPGGAVAGGVGPVARSAVSPGGATAAGQTNQARTAAGVGAAVAGGQLTDPLDGGIEETPVPGGAVTGGFAPGATVPLVIQGATAAGVTITLALVPLEPGGAAAGGQLTDPLQVFITAHYDRPTPGGGLSYGTPDGGHGYGTPDADVYDPPTPEKVLA